MSERRAVTGARPVEGGSGARGGADAPLLVVAGGHDETSLGWAAAAAWLRRDPSHRVLLTARSRKAFEFADASRAEHPDRVGAVRIDWAEDSASAALESHLEGLVGRRRAVAGVVHAVAGAPGASFALPAHALDPRTYREALDATTLSLFSVVRGSRAHLAANGGVVTFGFGEFACVSEEYGGALSVAKLALAHAIVVLGVSLGAESPPARTLEIVTGFIPTYAGRGVAAGISRGRKRRVSAAGMAARFAEEAALAGTTAEGQRSSAGELAASFVGDAMFRHTTGERIHVDGGWSTRAKSALPPVAGTGPSDEAR